MDKSVNVLVVYSNEKISLRIGKNLEDNGIKNIHYASNSDSSITNLTEN